MRLAAEQIFHMIEGWRYAASATAAYLSNSKHNSVHFSYYAELRAALSLLSWSGIRVRQGDHYYLDGQNTKIAIGSCRTHTAVWAFWQHWTNRADANSLFRNKIRFAPSVALADVLASLQYIQPHAALQNWGIDLAKIKDDHNARNTSSYEAIWATTPLTRMNANDAELILSLWDLILPSEGSGLRFDSALISHFVQAALPGMMQITGKNQSQITVDIAKNISQNTGADYDIILRRLNPALYNTTPFSLAASVDTNPENVMCRAFFLLRLSMLAVKSSLSSVTNTATTQWLSNWLEHAGLWQEDPNILPEDIPIDYENAIGSIDVSGSLPFDIWLPNNLENTARLVRPDACLVWNVL